MKLVVILVFDDVEELKQFPDVTVEDRVRIRSRRKSCHVRWHIGWNRHGPLRCGALARFT